MSTARFWNNLHHEQITYSSSVIMFLKLTCIFCGVFYLIFGEQKHCLVCRANLTTFSLLSVIHDCLSNWKWQHHWLSRSTFGTVAINILHVLIIDNNEKYIVRSIFIYKHWTFLLLVNVLFCYTASVIWIQRVVFFLNASIDYFNTVRTIKTCWPWIWIMCLSGATCLPADYLFKWTSTIKIQPIMFV